MADDRLEREASLIDCVIEAGPIHDSGRITFGPDRALYVLTGNRDGRGSPEDGDDRVLRLTLP